MSESGADNVERLGPAQAESLIRAFPGIAAYAEEIRKLFPQLAEDDPDAAMVPANVIDQAISDSSRWLGLRDVLTATHPVAVKLKDALISAGDTVPVPDGEVVDGLRTAPGFAMSGRIVTVHGVPIPAGEAQTSLFVALRWRPLFSPLADPARIYRGDLAYDAENVTDEYQEWVLLVSTHWYRASLALLQRSATSLYIAMWLRDISRVDELTAATPVAALPQPYRRSRLSRYGCLLLAFDVMSEWERGFELLDALKFEGGATRTSVKTTLSQSLSMQDIYSGDEATHRHLAGAAAHTRALHPTMNRFRSSATGDVVLDMVKTGINRSELYASAAQRVIKVSGEKPARLFLGVEPVKLVPVQLIHMHENVVRHEGKFWLRRAGIGAPPSGKLLDGWLMKLAIIVTSNICPFTAAAMLGRPAADLAHEPGQREYIQPLIDNPRAAWKISEKLRRDEDQRLFDASETRVQIIQFANGDSDDFKYAYEQARRRAETCSSAIGEPGWTIGFRPDAWRQPEAELDFLRTCCRWVLYDPVRDPKNRAPAQVVQGSRQKKKPKKPVDLPTTHMVERIHDLFRWQFDRVQVPELVRGHKLRGDYKLREALIRVIALMLPALSPITDDPNHYERVWADIQDPTVCERVDIDWNT